MKKNPYFIAVIISLLFYAVFIFALTVVSNITSTYQWSDRFTLGQFMIEFCLVPIAITGFVVTITELRKAQQRASLDIFWMKNEKELSKTITVEYTGAVEYKTPLIVLTNNGNAPSIQYQINLEYPLSYGRVQMTSSDWKHSSQQIHKFIFRSAAQYISFPEDKIELGIMKFLEPSHLPKATEICYRIYSDNSEYKEGRLLIKFQKAG